MSLERCFAYSDRHGGKIVLVAREGTTMHAHAADGFDAATPHALYSGTKSFWGTLAAIAASEELLSLDETVAATFPEWSHGDRAAVTLRHLLTLTSGIRFGGLGNGVPMYPKALAVGLEAPAGSTFTYGGIPLQIFGAVLAAKLSARGRSPHDYLRERLLEPAGCTIDRWWSLADGTQPLPTGAFASAEAWARYGMLIAGGGTLAGSRVIAAGALAQCFDGTVANPRYGLGWWLSPLPARPDIVYASGSGGQAMYVLREEGAVIVRFGDGGSFKHDAFLKAYLLP